MKIRQVTPETSPKVSALLRQAFPGSGDEVRLVEALWQNGKPMHEWIALHTNRVIAYIAFSNAFNGTTVCGLHLAPLAVSPEFQGQGIGSELLRFALRQEVIRTRTIFVLGDPGFYTRFGFEPCAQPICPFDQDNAHFLSIRNPLTDQYTVGYEAEFGLAGNNQQPARGSARQPARRKRKKRKKMNIDITAAPPADIFRDRGKHLWSSVVLLALAACGLLLITYGILSDSQPGKILETVALALLVGPALLFSYSGAKLNNYKKLSVGQKKELVELSCKHEEIATYFALVAKEGREPIFAEYEACKEWEENFLHQQHKES